MATLFWHITIGVCWRGWGVSGCAGTTCERNISLRANCGQSCAPAEVATGVGMRRRIPNRCAPESNTQESMACVCSYHRCGVFRDALDVLLSVCHDTHSHQSIEE